MASKRYEIPANEWCAITTGNNDLIQVTHNLGLTTIYYTESNRTPATDPDKTAVSNYSHMGDVVTFFELAIGEKIYVYAKDKTCHLTFTAKDATQFSIERGSKILEVV